MTGPVTVEWEIATDDTMRTIVRRGTLEADARLYNSVHVWIAGLQPNRPYWYRFTAFGAQSPVGRARTAPAANARLDRMRFAFTSCSNWQVGDFSAYRHIAAENPDLVLFLGDYIYEFTDGAGSTDKVLRPTTGRPRPILPATSEERGYTRHTVTRKTWTADFRALERVTTQGAPVLTRKSLVVEADITGAERMIKPGLSMKNSASSDCRSRCKAFAVPWRRTLPASTA